MKSLREYMDKLDEITRGAFIDPQGQHAVRPTTQQQRDTLAKGLKTARSYNRSNRDYYAQTDSPDQAEMGVQNARARGATSGSVIQQKPSGEEYATGMPVDIGANEKWQTGTVRSNSNFGPKLGKPASAKDGKPGFKKPSSPW